MHNLHGGHATLNKQLQSEYGLHRTACTARDKKKNYEIPPIGLQHTESSTHAILKLLQYILCGDTEQLKKICIFHYQA